MRVPIHDVDDCGTEVPDNPADGYYEWHTVGKTKTPYYIHPAEGLITFAGLYSWWRDPAKDEDDPDRWVLTATILTTDAHGGLAEIHDRVPLVIPPDFWSMWLDPEAVGDQDLVDAAIAASTEATERLEWHRVGPVRENGPHLIEPLE
jgi:putative SOS response-associated peptidase YedK